MLDPLVTIIDTRDTTTVDAGFRPLLMRVLTYRIGRLGPYEYRVDKANFNWEQAADAINAEVESLKKIGALK